MKISQATLNFTRGATAPSQRDQLQRENNKAPKPTPNPNPPRTMARASFILWLQLPTMHCIVRLKLGQEENKESDPRGKRKNRTKGGIPPLQSRVANGNSKQFFFLSPVSDVGGVFVLFFRGCASLGIRKERIDKNPKFKFRSLRKTHCRRLKTSGVQSQGIPLLSRLPHFTPLQCPSQLPPLSPAELLCNTETLPRRPEHVCSPLKSPESEVDSRNFPEITVSISRLQTSQRRWCGSRGKVVSECFCSKLLCYSCCNARDLTVAG